MLVQVRNIALRVCFNLLWRNIENMTRTMGVNKSIECVFGRIFGNYLQFLYSDRLCSGYHENAQCDSQIYTKNFVWSISKFGYKIIEVTCYEDVLGICNIFVNRILCLPKSVITENLRAEQKCFLHTF